MTKLVVAFRYFAKAPKNYYWSPVVNGWVSRKKILKRSCGGEPRTDGTEAGRSIKSKI